MTNLIAVITAYCACTNCCGPNATGLTAAGRPPVQGITIAGPRAFPLGTKVSINGHSYVVQDRTAKRYDGRWDIYFARHQDALNFGKQTNNITVYGQR